MLSLKITDVNNTVATLKLKTPVFLWEEDIDTKQIAKSLHEELKLLLTEENIHDVIKSYNYKNAYFSYKLAQEMRNRYDGNNNTQDE